MQRKIAVVLAAIMLMAIPAISGAATVRSTDIYAADGTSGQNLTSGTGIKTGHIQNSAVTGAKIASGTITGSNIANGAITDAKITGPISASKLDLSGTQQKYAQVVVVAQSGGDFATPINALASITDASASKPYLVKIMPGVYDLGAASLQMKDFVDVEGSGPEVTLITSANYSTGGGCAIGTVHMANNTAIRNLKIRNTASNPGNAQHITALVFDNVVAKAEGVSILTGSYMVGATNNGVCASGVSTIATLNNVYIEVNNNAGPQINTQSNAIEIFRGNVTLTNSKIVAKNPGGEAEAINNAGCVEGDTPGKVIVVNSALEAEGTNVWGIEADSCAFTTDVSNSFIKLTSPGTPVSVLAGQLPVIIVNSRIEAVNGIAGYGANPSVTRFVNSQVPGNRDGLIGATLTNCYDENYRPIPNQPQP